MRCDWASLQILQVCNVVILLICLAFYLPTATDLIIAYCFCFLFCGVGVFAGYHRLLTHGKPELLRSKIYSLLGCMAGSGPPVGWVATHIAHHRYSDTAFDPHIWERLTTGKQYTWEPWRGLWLRPGCPSITQRAALRLFRYPIYRYLTKYYYVLVAAWVLFLSSFGPQVLLIVYAIPAIFSILAQTAIVSLSHRNGKAVDDWRLWPLMWGECLHDRHHKGLDKVRAWFDPISYLV